MFGHSSVHNNKFDFLIEALANAAREANESAKVDLSDRVGNACRNP